MRLVCLTGNHPRHLHIVRALEATGYLVGAVFEVREEAVPAPPDGLDKHTSALFVRHFRDRAEAEARFFGRAEPRPSIPTLEVEKDQLNSEATIAFLKKTGADTILSYGVHILSPAVIESVTGHRWNIHGGLSPWYRGAITHFWPSYFLEPQFTGMTVHELTPKIDGGAIVHHSTAKLVKGDGIHDLACRAVSSIADELKPLLDRAEAKALIAPLPQKTNGKLWLASDWRPEHLNVIYDLYENRIVDRYLAGEFGKREPPLVRQF